MDQPLCMQQSHRWQKKARCHIGVSNATDSVEGGVKMFKYNESMVPRVLLHSLAMYIDLCIQLRSMVSTRHMQPSCLLQIFRSWTLIRVRTFLTALMNFHCICDKFLTSSHNTMKACRMPRKHAIYRLRYPSIADADAGLYILCIFSLL